MIRSPFDRVFVLVPLVFVALALRWLPNIWFVVVPYHVMCLTLPFVERDTAKRVQPLRVVPTLWGHLVIAVTAVVLGAVLAYLDVISLLRPSFASFVARLSPQGAFAIYSAVLNPFAEEWFWRGFIVDRWGITESAVWFALLHLSVLAFLMPVVLSAVMILPVFAAAVYWGHLRRSTGSLWPCVFTHLGVDVGILLAISVT
jgi:membrane protease YdiL (CAAX protease family)